MLHWEMVVAAGGEAVTVVRPPGEAAARMAKAERTMVLANMFDRGGGIARRGC